MKPNKIPSVRISPDNETVLKNLGLLAELAGTWHGEGFNLIGRPDFQDNANVFLELNLTRETLTFDPISSSIPNRGTFQDDIELFGLTYLQKISDSTTGGALHIEPGIWVTQSSPTDPVQTPSAGVQLVGRMGSIPHGNALLAEGTAAAFVGTPTIDPGAQPTSGGNPAFSSFPSFNSTPFTAPFPTPIFSAGTSEAQSKPGGGFSEYTLANAATLGTSTTPPNPRTPLGNVPPVLSPSITQTLVNDPITLLQQTIQQQVAEGHTFEGTVLNIATVTPIEFFSQPSLLGSPPPPKVSVALPQFGGGIENLPFLQTNAVTVVVYATFWIEKVSHPDRPTFMQLQYAQMVLLNFPAILIPAPPPLPGSPPPPSQGKLNFSWPHVSVATLKKVFG
jgi:hypothetical protein